MSSNSDDDLGSNAGEDAAPSPSNAPNTANPLSSPQNLLQQTLAAAALAGLSSSQSGAHAPTLDFTQVLLAMMQQQNDNTAAIAAATTPQRAAPREYFDPVNYDINKPPAPPQGRLCAEIKPPSYLEWTGQALKTAPLSDFLPQVERFCALQCASHPVLLASSLLTKDAGAWVSRNFTNQRLFTTTWNAFKAELIGSSLNDLAAPQRLVTDLRFLAQGTSTIKAFCERATSLKNKATTHDWLCKCPEEFFCEYFRGGLSPEIQSRMRPITASSTFQNVVAEALRIGTPLEANPVGLPLKNPNNTRPPPFRYQRGEQRGEQRGAGRGAPFNQVSTTDNATASIKFPQGWATWSEQAKAAWERSDCTREQRRALRFQRGACPFCGISGHKFDTCPETRPRELRYIDAPLEEPSEVLSYTIDASRGPNANGSV
jgi:hypothetical protein